MRLLVKQNPLVLPNVNPTDVVDDQRILCDPNLAYLWMDYFPHLNDGRILDEVLQWVASPERFLVDKTNKFQLLG